MRLKNFTEDADVDATMEYLEKRHPLYFMNKKFQRAQVRDLVQRIKYRLISRKKANAIKSADSAKPLQAAKKIEKENEPEPKVTFKSGSQLPSLLDEKKQAPPQLADLPSLKPPSKGKVQFDDEIELSEHESDFDADALLDLGDY